MPSSREEYERQVRGLRDVADAMLADGIAIEQVGQVMVDLRNTLKARFRGHDDPAIVAVMEMRNQLKYGHPLGPDAGSLLVKYGTWALVIDAACRPARLSGS